MRLQFLHAYRNLVGYLPHIEAENAWERYMINPFWPRLAKSAPFPLDFMKPGPVTDAALLRRQAASFAQIDFTALQKEFEKTAAALPLEEEEPMLIAFYPSANSMEEGVYGTGVWGNVILNINMVNEKAVSWIPFVFAHEYHHGVLGYYWYGIRGGSETKGNFLESLINEGQADLFAQSLYPHMAPSWHRGVTAEGEKAAWEKLKDALYEIAPADRFAPYMFGDEALSIPPNAGYYFGCKIVKAYLEKHPQITFSKLVQIPHQVIFDESGMN